MQASDQFIFPIIAPSIIAADWMVLGEEIQTCVELGLPWLHCDVMDGHFVPNITFGPDQLKAIKQKFPSVVCDAHLMVSSPSVWIPKFIEAGAGVITVHVETCTQEDITRWSKDCEQADVIFGLSIRPTTPLEVLKPWISFIKIVNVMSVYPGFFGQKYIEGSEQRIQSIRALAPRDKLWIQVDGGINPETGKRCSQAGANIFIAGGAFFKSPDKQSTLTAFKSALKENA